MLGPSGVREDDDAADDRRLRDARRRLDRLAGEDVSRLPPYDRPVNTVFQDYALFPHMTVRANVEYGLSVKSVAKGERRERAAGALRMVRLGGTATRKPSQLSGGQRQRVALARAIVNRAEGAPARRAARRARPEAPAGDADRAQGHPAGGRDHLRLRDARPGGGAHHVRPPRRVQPGPHRAGRAPRGGLRAPAERVHRGVRRRVERARARRAAVHGAPGEDHAPRRRGAARIGCARRGRGSSTTCSTSGP